jgi:hypothetical protein
MSRMDAATELTWTYLQRPLQTHTVPPNQQTVAHRLFAAMQEERQKRKNPLARV